MSSSELDHWLKRLESVHPKSIELGLERVASVAQRMALLPEGTPVVTVAGTNGKGSTIAVLEALILTTGKTTGVFTSPHFTHFNERVRLNGQMVTDEQLVSAFSAIDDARGNTSLTYFEFSALAALWIFKAEQPDFIVLEVGLGGRLDAVNIVDPSVAVITSIDLDHCDWLGDSRDEIAAEKAGILRAASPTVVADRDPPQSLVDRVHAVGAYPALFIQRDFTVHEDVRGWQGRLHDGGQGRIELPRVAAGALIPDNIVAALQAAVLLGLEYDWSRLSDLLADISVHGRREFRSAEGVDYILDVAHNPASVNKLLEYIDVTNCKKRIIAVFSALKDKDVAGIISASAMRFDAWLLADQPNNPRAVGAQEVADLLRDAGQSMISASRNVTQAMRRAQNLAGEGDTIVVFGSFSTVAEGMRVLDKDELKKKVG